LLVKLLAYRLLYPLRTYLVVSGAWDVEANVMAADWVTVLSAKPFLIGVAVSPKRYTHSLIEKYGEFVISVPNINMIKDVWIVGSESGPSKLSKVGFTLVKAKSIKTPIVKEAVANLECRVIDKHVYGDHTFFVGMVVDYSYDPKAYVDTTPNLDAGFIAHIAWNKFIKISGEVVET